MLVTEMINGKKIVREATLEEIRIFKKSRNSKTEAYASDDDYATALAREKKIKEIRSALFKAIHKINVGDILYSKALKYFLDIFKHYRIENVLDSPEVVDELNDLIYSLHSDLERVVNTTLEVSKNSL